MPPGILRCNSECPIHPKTAIFNRPIQGGFAHQKRYARVQPGHSVGSDNMQRCNLNQMLYSSSFPGCIIAWLVLNWIIAHLLDRDRVEHRTAHLPADVCL